MDRNQIYESQTIKQKVHSIGEKAAASRPGIKIRADVEFLAIN